jgi:ubiquitin-conjugating enzyme E2 variant
MEADLPTIHAEVAVRCEGSALALAYRVGALAFVVLLAVVLGRIAEAPFRAENAVVLAIAAALGIAGSDLVSGVVHWLCDTFFAEDTPILGRAVIHPFREHHRDPLAITRRDFFSVNGSNIFLGLLALGLGLCTLAAPETSRPLLGLHGFLATFSMGVVLTNQLHCWAHQPTVPRAVAALQRIHLVIPPEHHARHHRPGGSGAYCVTTGWLNPLVDRAGVFTAIERAARSRKGATRPRCKLESKQSWE